MRYIYIISIAIFALWSCTETTPKGGESKESVQSVTIFHMNDIHAQIDRLSKVKYIIDEARETENVFVVISGDMFSGNPYVDSFEKKGYPMIDLLNRIGIDAATIGNHEFDYGQENLIKMMELSNFPWISANLDVISSPVPEPKEYVTVSKKGVDLTFLGLIETEGKDGDTIPSTHPARVDGIKFYKADDILSSFSDLKKKEGAEVYIALSHLGHVSKGPGDYEIAKEFGFFDLIIGGHTHSKIDTIINDVSIFQSGSYLHSLGKIVIDLDEEGEIVGCKGELIDLDSFDQFDPELKDLADNYNQNPFFETVIGDNKTDLSKTEVGVFYTEALVGLYDADLCFQNTGGVRAGLDAGDITRMDIYNIAPFNNGLDYYSVTVAELKQFLVKSKAGFYYSGIKLSQSGDEIEVRGNNGKILSDNLKLKLVLNDYLSAVHEDILSDPVGRADLTAAESIIKYTEQLDMAIDYSGAESYFKFK